MTITLVIQDNNSEEFYHNMTPKEKSLLENRSEIILRQKYTTFTINRLPLEGHK